jgi:hypothetical protein
VGQGTIRVQLLTAELMTHAWQQRSQGLGGAPPCLSVLVCSCLGWVTHNCSRAAAAVAGQQLLEALCPPSVPGPQRWWCRLPASLLQPPPDSVVVCGVVCLVPVMHAAQHTASGVVRVFVVHGTESHKSLLPVWKSDSDDSLLQVPVAVYARCVVTLFGFQQHSPLIAGRSRLPGTGLTFRLV